MVGNVENTGVNNEEFRDLFKVSINKRTNQIKYTLSFPPENLKIAAALLNSFADARTKIFDVVKRKTGKSIVGYHDVHPVLQKIDQLSRKKSKEERERFMKDILSKSMEFFRGA